MTNEPVKVKLAVNDLVRTDDDNEEDENAMNIMARESEKWIMKEEQAECSSDDYDHYDDK